LYHGLRFTGHRGDPLDGLEAVAAEAGTSASTVAGALWGAIHGASAFPSESRTASELSLVIDELADAIGHVVANGRLDVLFDRFPGG
jgi:hypothetical protein